MTRTPATLAAALAAALAVLAPQARAQAPASTAPTAAPAAPAQAAAPTRVRGTIASVDGNTLVVNTREGARVSIALADNLAVSALRRVDPAGIAAGSYVGAAAEPGEGDVLVARSLVVFPESARGTAEGQFPWDLAPNTSMTNATVSATVTGTGGGRDGRDLELRWGDRTARIRVTPETPVVTPVPAARADLVPGAQVFLSAARAADGGLSAARVTVAKDGVAPPM